jgi:hypothetical protein
MRPIYYFIEYVINNLFPILEYSDKEIAYLINKFKEEADDFNIEISDDDLKKYIERFDQLKNSPNITNKDLRKYSLKQLLKTINVRDVIPDKSDEEDKTPDVVYNENGLIIYNGSKHDNCINFGRGEKWCITRHTNNFANFRYGNREVTFYLVKDTNKPDSNKDSFFVIHVLNNGEYKWTDRSNSPGESEEMGWTGIEERFPVLRGLKSIFKYIPVSGAEKKSKERWNSPISFRDWVINYDVGEKQKYIIYRIKNKSAYGSLELFKDLGLIDFFKKIGSYDKIAKWIVESPSLFENDVTSFTSLLIAFDSFKPNYQKSLINNIRSKVIFDLDSDKYSWELKKELIRANKFETEDNSYFYLFDENTIVKLTVKDNTFKLSLFLEDVDYQNVKINQRTSKYLAGYTKNDLPVDILINTIRKNDLDPQQFNVEFEGNKTVNIDGKDVIFNFKNLVAIDANTKKVLSFDDEKIRNEFVKEIQNNEELNESVLKLLIKPGIPFREKGISFENLIPLVEKMQFKEVTYQGNNSYYCLSINNAIYLFESEIDDFSFKVPILYNESNPNGVKGASLTPELSKIYIQYLRIKNQAYSDNELVRIFERFEDEPYESKINLVNANIPMSANSRFAPKIIKDRIFLVNKQSPENGSKKISFKTGKVLDAVIRTKGSANPIGLRPGAGRRGRPVGGGNRVNQAVVPVPGVRAGQTVAQILRANDIYSSTDILPLRRVLDSEAVVVNHPTKGAARRTAIIGNRGRIIQTLKVTRGNYNSDIYIIEFNDHHKIASIVVQPGALHFVCFEDRIQQIRQFSEFAGALRGLIDEGKGKKILKKLIIESVKKLKEAEYSKIFKPATFNKLKSKSGESLQNLIGNKPLMQIMMRSQELLNQISDAEKNFRPNLEKLAVRIVKTTYPVIDYAGIQIDAKIVDMGEIDLQNFGGGDEESIDKMPENIKRRIINGITQGGAVRGAYAFHLFKDNLDKINPDLISKYKEILNLSFGVFDNDEAIALMMAMLAQRQKIEGGSAEAEFNEETGVLTIHARALNFPMLVHEIVKGLYEIVSLQGFGPDKEKNKDIVKNVDKLENEPEDTRYGKFIFDSINDLYLDSEFDDPRVRDFLFSEIYKLPEDEFMSFIENSINGELTPNQKRWAQNAMKDISKDIKKDDTNLPDLG